MMNETETPLVHTVPEACQRIKVGRTMLYQLFNEGEIKHFKVGVKTLIPETELKNYVLRKMAENN
jgi:excisionase family DNA binding protein